MGRGSGLPIREGSMERWCSSRSLKAQSDSGIWERGGGDRGKPQMREAWGMPWKWRGDLHGRTAWG